MRRTPLLAARAWLILLTLGTASAAHALTRAEMGCQASIAKEAAQFAERKHEAILRRCNSNILGGVDCDPTQPDSRIARSQAKLVQNVTRRCQNVALESLAFPGACANPGGGQFSVEKLTACLVESHEARVDMAIALEYPDMERLAQQCDTQACALCQRQIARAGRSFISRKLRALRQCLQKQLQSGAPLSLTACFPNSLIEQASTDLNDRLGRACAGITLEALGFPGSCSDADGGAFSVENLQTCIHDTHEQEVEELITIEYASVGGTPPTATVTPTPT